MRISARLNPADFKGPFAEWRRFAEQRMERAALIAVDKAALSAKNLVRDEMKNAGLGRLGNAVTATSDLQRGSVHRRAGGGFSASGMVYVRSKSERTLGAIEAYTQGADIKPVKGRWLWIPTDYIQRTSKRFRLTPALWNQNGLDRKIGPLVMIKSVNGNPLLVVKDVGVDVSGKKRSARGLLKSGLPRKGQVQRELIVAFVGIPRTSRAARVDVNAIMESVARELPDLFYQALGRI